MAILASADSQELREQAEHLATRANQDKAERAGDPGRAEHLDIRALAAGAALALIQASAAGAGPAAFRHSPALQDSAGLQVKADKAGPAVTLERSAVFRASAERRASRGPAGSADLAEVPDVQAHRLSALKALADSPALQAIHRCPELLDSLVQPETEFKTRSFTMSLKIRVLRLRQAQRLAK